MYQLKRLVDKFKIKLQSRSGSAAYWTSHMVVNEEWLDSRSSLEYFHWRNAQYPGYIDLMPVSKADGLTVVDYGCGPGNDLVGFSEFSEVERLIGIDVSLPALNSAEKRLALHGKKVELIHISEENNSIPLKSNSVDLVHSSGVLHHVVNLEAALKEIHRILRQGSKFQVMVYNYDSLWVHLYTAFVHQIELGLYSDMSIHDAFSRTTDGPECPISNCYRPCEFTEFVNSIGFSGGFKGSSISLTELKLLPKRYAAIESRKLSKEHREFLSALKFNEYGHPLINGYVAGINACYEFVKQ